MPTKDVHRCAKKEVRPRFSDKRWQSLKNDFEYLRSINNSPESLNTLLRDAGFNSPPSWTVLGSTTANAVPIKLYV